MCEGGLRRTPLSGLRHLSESPNPKTRSEPCKSENNKLPLIGRNGNETDPSIEASEAFRKDTERTLALELQEVS